MNSSDRWNMDHPTPAEEPPGAPAPRKRSWGLGQRRTFLVDRPGQIRTTVLAGGVVATVLTVVLATLHVSRERATEALVAHVPSLAETLAAQNRIELTFQLAGAIVFLIMVVVVTLLETHKTAGAAFNLGRQMERVRAGEYGTRVTLRRGDNLQSVGRAFNEMSIAIDERFCRDMEIFSDLVEQAGRVTDSQGARQLAEALEEHASERRRTVGLPEDPGPLHSEPAACDPDRIPVS